MWSKIKQERDEEEANPVAFYLNKYCETEAHGFSEEFIKVGIAQRNILRKELNRNTLLDARLALHEVREHLNQSPKTTQSENSLIAINGLIEYIESTPEVKVKGAYLPPLAPLSTSPSLKKNT